MIKYSKIINEETKLCEIGTGTNSQFYEKIGMILQDVEQSDIDNNWYLVGYAPMYTEEELVEIEKERISNLEISQEKFWNFMDPSTRNDAKIEIEKVSGLENKIYNSLENPTYKRDCLIIEILTGIYNLSDSELDLLFDTN